MRTFTIFVMFLVFGCETKRPSDHDVSMPNIKIGMTRRQVAKNIGLSKLRLVADEIFYQWYEVKDGDEHIDMFFSKTEYKGAMPNAENLVLNASSAMIATDDDKLTRIQYRDHYGHVILIGKK